MSVYVDSVRNRLGRMIMCHMWADTERELFDMAEKLEMRAAWVQRPPKVRWVHYDLSLGRKQQALSLGAILTDKYGFLEFVARQENDIATVKRVARLRKQWAKRMSNANDISKQAGV